MNGCKYILTVCVSLIVFSAASQTRDTLDIYKKIKRVFYRHHVTALLYDAIFVDAGPKVYDNKPLSDKQKTTDPNLKYDGKIIRDINIKVFDPFGYSVHDTAKEAINSLQKIANRYHITSRHFIIKNILIIKKGEPLNLLKFNESERLLRAASYINDAIIYIVPLPGNPDSVDIKVFVHDSWTVDLPVSGGFTSGNATLIERNFLGFGHRVSQYGSYDATTGFTQFNGSYSTENIHKSHIAASLFYTTNRDLTQAGYSFNRPFFSALTRWAGGVGMTKSWGAYNFTDTVEKINYRYHLDNINTDVWAGRSFNPGWGIPVNRPNTNFIVSLRYANTMYQSRPPFTIDTVKANVNSSLWLGSVGFSLRKYYKDLYIYRFGANEDVAEGLLIQALYGFQFKELSTMKYYSGVDFSDGKHFEKFGYISVNATYGTFWDYNGYNNGTLNAGLYYFSNLLQNNKWYFREFIRFNYVQGFNKLPAEKIIFRPDEMYGFDAPELKGNSKMVLNLEAVTYTPYNLIGFRFAPLVLVGMGMIETQEHAVTNSPLYKSFALGLLIRNENLINNSFQFTFGLYPDTPDTNGYKNKYNPIAGFSLKIRSFAVQKPSVVVFE